MIAPAARGVCKRAEGQSTAPLPVSARDLSPFQPSNATRASWVPRGFCEEGGPTPPNGSQRTHSRSRPNSAPLLPRESHEQRGRRRLPRPGTAAEGRSTRAEGRHRTARRTARAPSVDGDPDGTADARRLERRRELDGQKNSPYADSDRVSQIRDISAAAASSAYGAASARGPILAPFRSRLHRGEPSEATGRARTGARTSTCDTEKR